MAPDVDELDYAGGGLPRETNWWGAFVIGLAVLDQDLLAGRVRPHVDALGGGRELVFRRRVERRKPPEELRHLQCVHRLHSSETFPVFPLY